MLLPFFLCRLSLFFFFLLCCGADKKCARWPSSCTPGGPWSRAELHIHWSVSSLCCHDYPMGLVRRRHSSHKIDAFPYYCPGARRGNVFVATWLLCPRPRSTSIARTVCESNCDHARFLFGLQSLIFFWCWEDQDALSRTLFCFSLNN